MSIYICCHPIDFEFALTLQCFVSNLGFHATFYFPNCPISDLKLGDKLIVVFRPELVKSKDIMNAITAIESSVEVVPVLRAPISINDWSEGSVVQPVVDFSNNDNNKQNLDLLSDILLKDGSDRLKRLSPDEIYLNNLLEKLSYFRSSYLLLEYANFGCNNDSQTPVDYLISKTDFKIQTLNRITKSHNYPSPYREDNLENIIKYYKSFSVVCNEYDCSAITFYLVSMASQRALNDSNAPIPILLDAEKWKPNKSWTNWLCDQINYLVHDISDRRFVVYVYAPFGLETLKKTLEEWINTRPSQSVIVICSRFDQLDTILVSETVISPITFQNEKLREICLRYSDRTFCQFLARSIQTNTFPYAFNYLLQDPVFAAILFSIKFDHTVDFNNLNIRDCFEILLNAVWNMMHSSESNDDIISMDDLAKMAALAVETQTAVVGYQDLLSLFSSQTVVTQCIDTRYFLINGNDVRFSTQMIRDYLAANALVKFGIPKNISNLMLDTRFRRIRQKWDNSIVLACHLSVDKDVILKEIARHDPMLALICITSGIQVSSTLYSSIIEQNLSALTTLGDFRTEFALLLHKIDQRAAEFVFCEILRDGHWSIRLDALREFSKLRTVYLDGLAEAVAEINADTINQVAHVIRRLGTNALPTLFALLRKDNAKLRLNAAWALGETKDTASVPALLEALHDHDSAVSKRALASLGLLQDVNCVPYLTEYLPTIKPVIRKAVNTVLVQLQEAFPEAFTALILQMDPIRKRCVILALHDSASNNLVDFLLDLSHDENVDVRVTAIKELSIRLEPRVISRLEECLEDMSKSRLSTTTVSELVSKLLSNIQKNEPRLISSTNHPSSKSSSEIVKTRLLNLKVAQTSKYYEPINLSDEAHSESDDTRLPSKENSSIVTENSYVNNVLRQLREHTWVNSNKASKELREYVRGLQGNASLGLINQILETLNDSDWVIRWTGVEMLGWTGNIHVVPHLIQKLSDTNWKIRIAAIRALSEIGDHTAATGISKLTSDNNAVVREAAAEALGFMQGEIALQALKLAATDKEVFVRLAAVDSLGRLHHKDASHTLLHALLDESEHIRWAAASSLMEIADSTMVQSLAASLSDTGGPYWEQKRICDIVVDILKQIGTKEALNAIEESRRNQI